MYYVMEFWGKGDRYFGGQADDRPLGKDGTFLSGCYQWHKEVAFFETQTAAEIAAGKALKRKGGKVSVLRDWAK
jgi:hypothetical protein